MAQQDWLGWWTITEARKRLDALLAERALVKLEMLALARKFRDEYGRLENLPARLVIGSVSAYGGRSLRWRQRGAKGSGQTFVGLCSERSRLLLGGLPEAMRLRWQEYERLGFWLNAAEALRDREIKLIEDYVAALERQRDGKRDESDVRFSLERPGAVVQPDAEKDQTPEGGGE